MMPVVGWWTRRKECELLEQPFSLVVTILVPGMDIYTPTRPHCRLRARTPRSERRSK